MYQDSAIRRHMEDLLKTYGEEASDAAEERLRQEIAKGDVKAAGMWLTVLHEITRSLQEDE